MSWRYPERRRSLKFRFLPRVLTGINRPVRSPKCRNCWRLHFPADSRWPKGSHIKIRKRIVSSEHQHNIGARFNGVPHSTSRGVSNCQFPSTQAVPQFYRAAWGEDLEVGRRQSTKFVHAENVFASSTMVFEPKASTITIVPPCQRGQDFSVTCLRPRLSPYISAR